MVSVPRFLQSAAELRVEGHAERQPDVVLRLAAEAGHEVVKLEQADRDCIRGLPVITTAQSRGECVVGNREVRAQHAGAYAVMGEAEEAVNKDGSLLVGHLELGAKQVRVDVVVGSVFAVIAAVHVGRDAKSRCEP